MPLGGPRAADLRFCKHDCLDEGLLLAVARNARDGDVLRSARRLHAGPCPRCAGPGPVDLHVSHRVWPRYLSLATEVRRHVCCRRCGLREQLWDAWFCAAYGWWSLPWGLLYTPVQIARNLLRAARRPAAGGPSAALERHLRLKLAARALEEGADLAHSVRR